MGNQWQLALLLFNDLREKKWGCPEWSAHSTATLLWKVVPPYWGSCSCDKGNRWTDIPTDRQIDYDEFHFYCHTYLEYPGKVFVALNKDVVIARQQQPNTVSHSCAMSVCESQGGDESCWHCCCFEGVGELDGLGG